jgi:nucleotide-binding universal stress UspA family protein
MNRFNKILVPVDMTDHSRRAVESACHLADVNSAEMLILHVAADRSTWELCDEFAAYSYDNAKPWPLDRVVTEAALDLDRFLEPHLRSLTALRRVTRRVVLGTTCHRIIDAAETERIDLIVLAPRRRRGLRHWLGGGITDRVTRLSPCPVLSVTPPLPSKPWRGRLIPALFGWPRQSTVEA